MSGELSPTTRRLISLLLCIGAIVLGVLAIKRAVNGNADISGNYRLWRDNLTATTVPVRIEGQQPQDPDSYPPVTYAIFAPLGVLPLWATATVWYVLNLCCTIYLFRSAQAWLQSESGIPPETSITVLGRSVSLGLDQRLLLAMLAVLPYWIGCVLLGQNTLPLMSLTWGAFQALRRGRPWLAGGLLALATVLKVFPVVFLLPFIMRWHVRLLLAYAITGIMLVFGLGSLYFGPRQNLEHHLRWLRFAAQGPVDRPADPHDPNSLRGSLRYHNQSIEAVLARLLMDIPITNQAHAPRVNLVNVSAETWRRARTVTSGLLVILGLLALYRSTQLHRTDQSDPSDPNGTPPAHSGITSVETYAVLSLLQLFVAPIVWSHYYVWLFWPLLFVLVSAQKGRDSGYAIYVAWLSALPLIALPQVRARGLHLWLTIAVFLWICWPHIRERWMIIERRLYPPCPPL